MIKIWKFDESIKFQFQKFLEILLDKSSVEEEIELIRGLHAELECKQDLIMQEESETFEIFLDLYHKRLDVLYELDLKARKLEKFNHLGGGTDLTINENN